MIPNTPYPNATPQQLQQQQRMNNPGAQRLIGGMTGPLGPNQHGLMGPGVAARGGVGGMQRYFQTPTPAPVDPYPQVPTPQGPPTSAPTVPQGPTPEEIIGLWRRSQMPREPQVPLIPRVDDSDAWRATYGRAKETAGNQARRGLDALMEMQGARGILGGGLGINEIGQNIIGPAMNQLGDVNRQLSEQSYEAEVQRQHANAGLRMNQRGQDVTQRGQDMNLLPIIRSLYNVRY